jgi:hypothetical protein
MTPPLATYSVTTLTSLTAIPSTALADKIVRWVKNENSWYGYKAADATAADGYYVVASSGTGRWFRQNTVPSSIPNANVTGLAALLAAKANTSHTHTSTDITNFSEAVDDRVAALLVGGTSITLVYDDVSNILTINAGATYTDELAQDAVGNILTDSSIINFTYNDVANTITATINASSINDSEIASVTTSKITDFSEGVQDVVGALLAPGTNITLDYNDATNTLVINSTGGGGGGGITGITMKDEGITSGTDITSINFIGTGVSVATVGVQSNITINSTLSWDTIDKTTWDSLY